MGAVSGARGPSLGIYISGWAGHSLIASAVHVAFAISCLCLVQHQSQHGCMIAADTWLGAPLFLLIAALHSCIAALHNIATSRCAWPGPHQGQLSGKHSDYGLAVSNRFMGLCHT